MQLAYGRMQVQAAYDGKTQATCRQHASTVGPRLNMYPFTFNNFIAPSIHQSSLYLFAKIMLYSIKLRQIINMHGLLETAGYWNTSYADPWWTESTLVQDTIGSHIKITINRKTDAANCKVVYFENGLELLQRKMKMERQLFCELTRSCCCCSDIVVMSRRCDVADVTYSANKHPLSLLHWA